MRNAFTGGLLFLTLLGCGGSLKGNGPDGSSRCTAMGACECLAASDRCSANAESCWCPSECYPGAPIECFCGGGRFLSCQDKTVAVDCAAELAAFQSKCAGQPYVEFLSDMCTRPAGQVGAGSPNCIGGCLAELNKTGSCSEIDCSFCQGTCDCANLPAANAFERCLTTCNAPPPPSP